MDDDQIMLDPNSNIGMFVRRCLLTFNQMSFEVTQIGRRILFCGYFGTIGF